MPDPGSAPGERPVALVPRLWRRATAFAPARGAAWLNLAVFVGGAIGASLRLLLVDLVPVEAGRWPWATFVANLGGALLLGVVAARLIEGRSTHGLRASLLGTGLCGALTTFSGLQLEALRLAEQGHVGLAVAYVGVSIGAGLALVALGLRMAPGRRSRHR